ncbi:MAG TPA: DUF2877 domain-containing protein [Sulfolobales archaeon]|nr:DUF2877 domain-containing protein [Sulfolobales archaeon]
MSTIILRASSIGHIARKIIDRCAEGCRPSIHSTFPNAINITISDTLITIKSNRVRSEVDIVLDEEDILHLSGALNSYVSKRDEVSVRANVIVLGGNLVIDLGSSSTYIPRFRLSSYCPEEIFNIDMNSTAERFLKIMLILDKLYDEDLTVLGYLLKEIHRILEEKRLEGVRGFIEDRVAMVFKNLLGFGRGLTPSGDDILIGFLSTYNNLAPRCLGSQPIKVNGEELRRTTELSAHIIYNASKGVMNEVIDNMLTLNIGDDPLYPLLDLAYLGHSSGVMMGIGVLLALAICKAIWSGEEELHDLVTRFSGILQSKTI